MTQTHPIMPPPELVNKLQGLGNLDAITLAYQAGADQELIECLRYASDNGLSITRMRAARRPKPPSLKEQALLQLDTLNADLAMHGRGCDLSQIRRALEALND